MKKITKKKVSPQVASGWTDSNYKVTVTIGADVYQGQGASPFLALSSVPKPLKIMHKGVFTITDGEKKREVLMLPVRLRRLFYNKLYQQIQLKSLCMGMK